ncbi:FAD-dependent oxidoreductase [Nocardia sp. NPDC004068]|uniref:FAD-dependent oxidoreductase n=1 Tax=Nocardia sp. NPDC004068 TaxID=3364303 RepID=UPI003678A05F
MTRRTTELDDVTDMLVASAATLSMDIDALDWEHGFEPGRYFLPEHRLALYGTALWDRLDRAQRIAFSAYQCIDCGACAHACPVDAIRPSERLSPEQQPFRITSAAYFQRHPAHRARPVKPPAPQPVPLGRRTLEVAIVGAGPAGMYAAEELLRHRRVRVVVFDRSPEPGGLVRYGVAPDQRGVKRLLDEFAAVTADPRVRLRLGVEIGRDLDPAALRRRFPAVVLATGAAGGRTLDLPGARLPGNLTAHDLAAWANGAPTHHHVDLSHPRAVIIGNGNVALDAARLLLTHPDELDPTRVPPAVRNTLAHSAVREVVVIGRRGPGEATFTAPAIRALTRHQRIRNGGLRFRFHTAPATILGTNHVAALTVTPTRDRPTPAPDLIETGLVIHAVGAIAHAAGRVLAPDGHPRTGLYITGWAARGPRGKIGTNRPHAQATVHALLDDFAAGRLG